MNKDDFNSRRLDILYPHIAAEWDNEKNNGLRPSDVTIGSAKKVWWHCEKSHLWKASVRDRLKRHSTCPYCSGRKVLEGFNDLTTVRPDIASQWCYPLNGDLTPAMVTYGSGRKVWWECEHGHTWEATINSRTGMGSGCPYCAGKKPIAGYNDLKTLYPDIANEWNDSLNGELKPDMVSYGSNKCVWWECPEGHVWKALVSSRTNGGTGCPICAGLMRRKY